MSAEKEASSPERLSGEMTRNRNSGFMGLLKLRRYYVAKSEVYQKPDKPPAEQTRHIC